MQPKFTRKKLGLICTKVAAAAMAFVLSTSLSYGQERVSEKQRQAQSATAEQRTNNDIGRPLPPVSSLTASGALAKKASTQRTEAVCATFTGAIDAGDGVMPARLFRGGVVGTCGTNAFPGTSAGSFNYDTYTWNNTQAAPQCITVTLNTTDVTNANIQAGAWSGSFNPASQATNYLGDPGLSTGTPITAPLTFQCTVPASSTVVLVVWSANATGSPAGTASNYTLTVDGICAPCVPTNATAPTISSVPSSVCAGSSITLSILSGNLNGAANWKWYSGSCGGTAVGTGNSITVSPGVTTTYYARGEGGCAPANGPCGQQTVTVTPCTCLTPDVATICAGSIQKLQVTPTGATSTTFNGGAITINSVGTATPYPSNIAVSGLPASGAGVYVANVKINGFTHTFETDVDIVLQSPSGRNVVIMSDAGNGNGVSGLNLTFSDAATSNVPAPITTGTWKPTNIVGTLGVEPDNWPAPGPGSVTQPNPVLSAFTDGTNPNGTWKLFVVDDFSGDGGSITSWSITFSVVPTAVWTQSPAAPNSMFSDANATIPYVAGTATDAIWVQPATTTTYTATIGSGPCAGANNVTVNVLARPALSISPNPGGCAPVTLNATGASIYNWSPGTGLNTTSGPTVVATPGANTTYTVTGIGTNGCSNTASVSVNGVSTAAVISAPPAFNTLLSEGFDAAPLPAQWAQQNLSNPLGTGQFSDWFQGTTGGAFTPNSGADFRGASFLAGSLTSTLSNWLFSPVVTVQNGDVLSFYTIAAGTFADRLQVRWSSNGASVNAGATATSVGDFTALWQDINPSYSPTGYPLSWTKITITITGLSGQQTGRIAFRYFVENGGPNGANSNTIGLDDVLLQRPLSGVCANTLTPISVNITGGVSPYTVVFTNGTTNYTINNYVSGTPIQVSNATTTNYTLVSVTGANGCTGVGNSGTATVSIVAPAVISTQPSNVFTCSGNNAAFSVGVNPVTGNTYQWQVSTDNGATWTNLSNGGVYSNVTGSTMNITGATLAMQGYRYRAIVNGQCNTSPLTSNSATLNINVAPTITTQPANATACFGSSASFSVVAAGLGTTYQWQVSTDGGLTWSNVSGGTGSTLTVAGVTAAQNGYRYRVIVTNPNCATTATSNGNATLTTVALPVVTISAPDLMLTPGQTTTITATSTPAAAAGGWSWTLNGAAVAGTTNTQVADINGLGIWRARVTDVNGCSNVSNELVIGGEAADRLWIWPNPNNGMFQVRLYNPLNPGIEKRTVTIYKNNGQKVFTKEFTLDNLSTPYYQMNIDLRRLAAGTYVVKVDDNHTGHTKSGLVVISHD